MSKYPSAKYNSDGSFTPEYREQLESYKWDKDKINNLEQIHKRDAAVDKEEAYLKEQHRKAGEEWDRQYEAQKREKERLGIKPGFKILYVSPDGINVNDMNPSQRLSYEMRGLSTEELLSQGYVEPGNVPNRNYNTNDNDEDEGYIPENVPPEIPF